MSRLEKVIFDMDGLIFDTERLFMEEQMKIVREYGYSLTRNMYVQTLGLTGRALSEKLRMMFGDGYPEKEVTRRVRARIDERARTDRLPLKPGIRELLDFLRGKEILCAVASSTHTPYVRRYLESAGLDGYFADIIGGEMTEHSKPAPDIFIKAAGAAKREYTLVLEDSENGIRAAAAAGIPVICIPDMLHPSAEVTALAEFTVSSAAEVIGIVRGKYENT